MTIEREHQVVSERKESTAHLDAYIPKHLHVHVMKVVVASVGDQRQYEQVNQERAQIDLEYIIKLVAELMLEAIVTLGIRVAVHDPYIVSDSVRYGRGNGAIRDRVQVPPGAFVSGASDQAYVPEPSLVRVLYLVGELKPGHEILLVVLVQARFPARTRHTPHKILTAVLVALVKVCRLLDLLEHHGTRDESGQDAPLVVVISEIVLVHHGQHDELILVEPLRDVHVVRV